MENTLRLPVGVESFETIRRENYFYIDKTALIEQLLEAGGMVSLFTRPRRFGKTLNMSMLRCFFEIGQDPVLFQNLHIFENHALCETYLGKFPVIFLTLKDVDGLTLETARYQLVELIGREARRHDALKNSVRLDDTDQAAYASLTRFADGKYWMDDDTLYGSLQTLSALLYKHHQKKVIVLIDEYDVPLDKAFQNGYYREMVALIRSLFGKALKTNDALQLAVLTGCLRISKESIFTGLNNFKVLSITDARFDEQFGFTESEVVELLRYYHLESHMDEMKRWYDGYRFGDADIYCPWDVINHVDLLRTKPDACPQSYWSNTSGNALVKRFIDKADKTTQKEIEKLIAGESIEKNVHPELTYDEIDSSLENLWSVLFTTGYLTQDGSPRLGIYRLRIPNEEVREIFRQQIREWFRQMISKDTDHLKAFWQALAEGNAQDAESYLNSMLSKTISVLDPKGNATEKESFYHAFLTGLLVGNADWAVLSNREAGIGFADLLIETEDPDAGIIIELKLAHTIPDLVPACERAIQQIRDRRYDQYFHSEGREKIRSYGIAFCKKRCRVMTDCTIILPPISVT